MVNLKRQPSIKLAFGLYLAISAAALVVSAKEESDQDDFRRAGSELMDMMGGSKSRQNARHASEEEATHEGGEAQNGQHQLDHHKDPFYLASEYTKLMLNPIALIKKISHEFKLPKGKLIEKVGKGLVFGAEALFSPVIACVKIIEKVFVPDACRLKFVCQFGSRLDFMRETVLKFSPDFLDGSIHLKALSHGIAGRDCVQTYADCEPTLKEPYNDLKEPHQQQQQQQHSEY